jgi:tetratricopeptide (TPR) repeat protein
MLFWFFLGAIIVLDEKKMISLPLQSVKMSYAVSLGFVGLVALEMGLLVWNAKHYYAEVEYLNAVKALQNQDVATAILKLESAADATDRLQDNYLTGLSQIYLAQAESEVNKSSQGGANTETAITAAMPYLEGAVKTAMQSTEAANPNSSVNWASRGYIYRRLIGVSEGFDTWALNMYEKALQLEPSNPVLWNEIGQVYVMKNDLTKAKESFTRAAELRPQYVDPHYYLALIYDKENNKEAAIAELQNILALMSASEDKESIDNINKAIENLKAGKSLSGQDAGAAGTPADQLQDLQAPESSEAVPGIESTTGGEKVPFGAPAAETGADSGSNLKPTVPEAGSDKGPIVP